MIKIELIYDLSCPNIEKARGRIKEVLSELNMSNEWIEWDRADPKAPNYVKHYGSPTILVNKRDVANITDTTAGDTCRLYRDEKGGVVDLPSSMNIKQAIIQNTKGLGSRNLLTSLMAMPAIIVSSLPFLSCPLCWPLYTSMLGFFGLSFFNYSPYLFPFTMMFLFVALAAVWFQAKKAGSSYFPVWLVVISSALILVGKFLFITLWIVIPGVVGLAVSVLWNFILISRMKSTCCCADK